MLESLVFHLADDQDFCICHYVWVQRDAAANAVSAIGIMNRQLGADTAVVAHACMNGVGAILDVPCYSQFLWIETWDVTLQGPLLSFSHCCVLWQQHCRLSWSGGNKGFSLFIGRVKTRIRIQVLTWQIKTLPLCCLFWYKNIFDLGSCCCTKLCFHACLLLYGHQ